MERVKGERKGIRKKKRKINKHILGEVKIEWRKKLVKKTGNGGKLEEKVSQ